MQCTAVVFGHRKFDTDIYSKFKEKVIGKTFQIKHNIDNVLDGFLDESECAPLKRHRDVIKNIYIRSDDTNLRKLKQSILDFGYIANYIDEEKFKNNEILEEKITEITDKGFIISKEGYNIFIPISLSGITRSENIKDYKDKVVRFRLIECKFRPRRIIGSIKAILDEEKNKKIDEFWNEAEVGKKYKGKVTSISTYGAFVDLGAVQGLLHISEITWNRNTPPNEILKVGQVIDVIAIDVDKENKRIKLSYAEKGPDPWKSVEGKYNINDILTVKVVKMMPFGAFVELEPGIEGLVHLSQICERKITKPEEELRIGQKVNAKIIDMDLANKRIELSIRELENTSNEYKE